MLHASHIDLTSPSSCPVCSMRRSAWRALPARPWLDNPPASATLVMVKVAPNVTFPKSTSQTARSRQLLPGNPALWSNRCFLVTRCKTTFHYITSPSLPLPSWTVAPAPGQGSCQTCTMYSVHTSHSDIRPVVHRARSAPGSSSHRPRRPSTIPCEPLHTLPENSERQTCRDQ